MFRKQDVVLLIGLVCFCFVTFVVYVLNNVNILGMMYKQETFFEMFLVLYLYICLYLFVLVVFFFHFDDNQNVLKSLASVYRYVTI